VTSRSHFLSVPAISTPQLKVPGTSSSMLRPSIGSQATRSLDWLVSAQRVRELQVSLGLCDTSERCASCFEGLRDGGRGTGTLPIEYLVNSALLSAISCPHSNPLPWSQPDPMPPCGTSAPCPWEMSPTIRRREQVAVPRMSAPAWHSALWPRGRRTCSGTHSRPPSARV
jgi:hypothetical protein